MTGNDPIRVLVADDQALIREALATLIGTQPDLVVVGQAADGQQAVRLARELRPDIVLMDIRMPGLDGIAAARQILSSTRHGSRAARDAGPGATGTARTGAAVSPIRVIILTTYDLDEYVYQALHAGACGFLVKHAPPEELLLGIRAAADGGSLLSPKVTTRLLTEFTARRPAPRRVPADLDRLTSREREVLDLVIRGQSNTEIADELCVSLSTVKTHVTHIMDKLALRDRVQVVVYGYENGLVEPRSNPKNSPQ